MLSSCHDAPDFIEAGYLLPSSPAILFVTMRLDALPRNFIMPEQPKYGYQALKGGYT
jgi:hypothetical protein